MESVTLLLQIQDDEEADGGQSLGLEAAAAFPPQDKREQHQHPERSQPVSSGPARLLSVFPEGNVRSPKWAAAVSVDIESAQGLPSAIVPTWGGGRGRQLKSVMAQVQEEGGLCVHEGRSCFFPGKNK